MTTPSPEIIIALRQPWLALILHRTKTAELRRTHPSYIPDRLYLYHRRCIHGHADVAEWDTHSTHRQLVNTWADRLCMSRLRILEYLDGATTPIVYALANITTYPLPIPIPKKPQSWIYMTPAIRSLIPEQYL